MIITKQHIIISLLFLSNLLFSQEGFVFAGADITGNIKISYSCGQLNDLDLNQERFYNEGIQQPYLDLDTSTDEIEQLIELNLFPNPVFDLLHVSSNCENTLNYEIINLLGFSVLSGKLNQNNEIIEISTLASGSYHLIIHSDQPFSTLFTKF